MKIWREKDKELNSWIWKANFMYKKKRYRPTAFTKSDLAELITQIKSNADRMKFGLDSRAPKITLGQLRAEHTRDFDLDKEYYRRGKVVLELFLKTIGQEVEVENVTTSDLRTYVRSRRAENPKLQNSSINKDLTYISKMFSAAHSYFKELKDYSGPKIPWESESTRTNQRTIYKEESQKLLDYLRFPGVRPEEKANSPHIRGDYADMYEIALHSAMRWGEIAQLEWTMLNIRAGEIVLPKRVTKTEEPRVVYLNSRVREILTNRAKHKKTIWVFPREDGKTYRKYYYDRLRAICKKIGLPFGRDVGFTLHTTRHSAISEMLARGGDFAAVQQQSGHSDKVMAARYAHANRNRMHALVEKLTETDSD